MEHNNNMTQEMSARTADFAAFASDVETQWAAAADRRAAAMAEFNAGWAAFFGGRAE
jgi:hypothetical protein